MKELTIEQKAKAYDEAIERIREWSETKNGYYMPKELCEEIFPELCESKDERVRKAMIDFFKHEREEGITVLHYGVNIERMITWLEKQGEPVEINPTEFDTRLQYLIGKFDSLPKEELIGSLSFWLNVVQNDGTYREEKQGEQKPLFKKGDTVFWDGEEFNILDVTKDSYNVGGYIIPIYRQNELLLKQKSTDKAEPKFKVGDKIYLKPEYRMPDDDTPIADTIHKIIAIDDKHYRFEGSFIFIEDQDKFELVEQNPADKVESKDYSSIDPHFGKPIDKVEPKFKVGDWVVQENNGVYKVVKVCKSWYEVANNKDCSIGFISFDKECICHLWTIADAKDGDVLAYVTDKEDLWIMIYWSLYEPYEGHVHYHALLVNDNFGDKGICCICIDNLKPATKEQRELLFSKMKEAGYEWDEEKKDLKKIWSPTTWSEEDEKTLKSVITNYESGYLPSIDKRDEIIKKLKTFKLKKQWKPSKEQMEALWNVYEGGEKQSELASLYNDLKKL